MNACGEHVIPEIYLEIRLCLWKQESSDFRGAFKSRIYHDSSEMLRKKLTYIFVIINIVMGIISWQNWISFFPIFASIMATISLFIWESKKMRSGLLISEFCWTVNNLYYMNFGGLCANVLNIPLLTYHIIKKDPITMIEKDS